MYDIIDIALEARRELINMVKFDRQLTFSTKEYEDFEEMTEEMFWNDLYLYQLDTYYIHDTNQDVWYTIERRFHYADIIREFEAGKMIRFDEVKDEDLIQELEEILEG